MNLYGLLQLTQNSPDAPCINISVSLADLHQLVVDTIETSGDSYEAWQRSFLYIRVADSFFR